MSKISGYVIALLIGVIGFLMWTLWARPVEAPTVLPQTTTSPTTTSKPKPETPAAADLPLHSKVVVTYPTANAVVSKHFTVKGQAPGNWFFEASAPVMVRDPEGNKVGQGLAKAEGDWMTTKQVPFSADVMINPAYAGDATLILLRDNPSGLPENDDSLEIAIVIQ